MNFQIPKNYLIKFFYKHKINKLQQLLNRRKLYSKLRKIFNTNILIKNELMLSNNLYTELNSLTKKLNNIENKLNDVYKYIIFIAGLNILTNDDILNLLKIKEPILSKEKNMLIEFNNILINKYNTSVENHLDVYLHLILLNISHQISEKEINEINNYIIKKGEEIINLSINNNELSEKYKFLLK